MSIEVTNLSKSYGAQKALDSITFSVKKGEIVGFLLKWCWKIYFDENIDHLSSGR